MAVLIDLDNDQTRRGIEAYVNRVKRSAKPAVALMFFAGHGVQIDGHNYILLSNVPQLSTADDVRQHGIDVGRVLTDVARSGASAIGDYLTIQFFCQGTSCCSRPVLAQGRPRPARPAGLSTR